MNKKKKTDRKICIMKYAHIRSTIAAVAVRTLFTCFRGNDLLYVVFP